MLVVFVGLLFWYGEQVIGGASDPGYSVLSFKSASDEISLEEKDLDAMIFFIHNMEERGLEYKVVIFVDDREVDFFERKINFDKFFFKPAAPLKKHIEGLEKNEFFEFKVVVYWGDKEEFITKKIKKNE